jgi:hypothetical protein
MISVAMIDHVQALDAVCVGCLFIAPSFKVHNRNMRRRMFFRIAEIHGGARALNCAISPAGD